MKRLSLIQILKKHPDCLILYHDKNEWVIFRSKKDYDNLEKVIKNDPRGDRYDKYLDRITLCDQTDFPDQDGYADSLVSALAALQGITVESV